MLGNLTRSRVLVLVSCAFLVVFSILYVPRQFSELQPNSKFLKFKKPFRTHRDSETLPDFTNGGIIVFYHIYKTGGSTVGKMLHELAKADQDRFPAHPKYESNALEDITDALLSPSRLFFTMIRKDVDWEKDCLTSLDLAENHQKLILLELHVDFPAPNFPSLVELSPILDKWRAEADRRGVGFFAFTLIREPVAHALSFFNFFHVGNSKGRPPPSLRDHDYWNPFKPLGSNEKNFLRSYFANNRQCRMLNSDPQATQGAPYDLVWINHHLSEAEGAELHRPCRVDKVHDSYYNSLDWVGTTEFLQNETLPLLTQLVSNDPVIGRNNTPFKVFDNNPNGLVGLKKFDLSKPGMKSILDRTKLDRELYAEVTRNFRLTDLGWDYRSPIDG